MPAVKKLVVQCKCNESNVQNITAWLEHMAREHQKLVDQLPKYDNKRKY